MPTRAKKSKGLSVRTFSGLNKKRMEKRTFNAGVRVNIPQGQTVPVQFLTPPSDFMEFDQHSFTEDGKWQYIPCAGDDCPLDADEDTKRRKTGYRFCAVVYNLKEKKVQVLEGPKDLAGRIWYRYDRNPAKFLKRTYEITKFPTTPVSYGVDVGEDELVPARGLKLIDLQDYLDGELKRYYGDEMPNRGALDEDEAPAAEDDDEDEDEAYTLSDLKAMKLSKLQEIAEALEIEDYEDLGKSNLIQSIVAAQSDEDDGDADDDDDEDDEADDEEAADDDADDEDDEDSDDDDEDDEDDDEDDEPPARPAKASAKKASAKKAPAKTAARKTAARRR